MMTPLKVSIQAITWAIAAFFIFINCTPSESYLLQSQAYLRSIEREDHQRCIGQGIDFGEWGDVSTELYWRCRYNLVERRKIQDATSAADIETNAMIKKISETILKNLIKSRQAILSDTENDVEAFDHSKCLSMGFNLDINEPLRNEKYYECRKKLIDDRYPPTPTITGAFEASVLPKKEFDQYLAGVQQNKVMKADIDFASEMMDRYPACREVNVRSKFFKKCTAAQDKAFDCLNQIVSIKAKKELDDKVYCQQQAFVQFPDDYSLTRNKSAKEIAKMEEEKKAEDLAKLRAEKEANLTLKFLQEGYISPDVSIIKDRKIDEAKKAAEKKSKDDFYDKLQILELREEFIFRCNKLMQEKIPKYLEDESQKCLDIGKNWNSKDNEEL